MELGSMEDSKAQFSSGYDLGPPWIFKGRALYQLHLVRAEVARSLIPKEFKLVEAFGYTLGGFFLARYDDSPVAMFDEDIWCELVVIAGIVWNPPTSCAWAARVLVNNKEACVHGRKQIGLPSNVGIFSRQKSAEVRKKSSNKLNGFLSMLGISSIRKKEHMVIQVSEFNDPDIISLCNISLPCLEPKLHGDDRWMGPKITMSLPSFSGRTIYNPHLLKYACQIECRMRMVKAVQVSGPTNKSDDDRPEAHPVPTWKEDDAVNRCISILLSKPLFALEFNFLKMKVDAPTIVAPYTNAVKD